MTLLLEYFQADILGQESLEATMIVQTSKITKFGNFNEFIKFNYL